MQIKLHEWAEKVVQKYNQIGKSYYTQSDLTKIVESPTILILGINPGSTGIAKDPLKEEVFLKGNPNFYEREKWHLWKQLRKILSEGGAAILLDDESRFVFSNVFHCDTSKAKHLSTELKDEELVNLTLDLINILRPKQVLCLGKNDCWQELTKATGMKTIELIRGELNFGRISEIPIYGIKHTSSYYTNEECAMIGKVLGALFEGKVLPDVEMIAKLFKDEIRAFEERRDRYLLIEKAFEQEAQTILKKFDDKWYFITDDIIARVASNGYVNIHHSNFDPKDNYSKHFDDNKYPHREEIIDCLKKYGYELKKNDAKTSLGQKMFSKYPDSERGPHFIAQSILKEFAMLKIELQEIFALAGGQEIKER